MRDDGLFDVEKESDDEKLENDDVFIDSSMEDDADFALLAPIPLQRQMGRIWKTFDISFALL